MLLLRHNCSVIRTFFNPRLICNFQTYVLILYRAIIFAQKACAPVWTAPTQVPRLHTEKLVSWTESTQITMYPAHPQLASSQDLSLPVEAGQQPAVHVTRSLSEPCCISKKKRINRWIAFPLIQVFSSFFSTSLCSTIRIVPRPIFIQSITFCMHCIIYLYSFWTIFFTFCQKRPSYLVPQAKWTSTHYHTLPLGPMFLRRGWQRSSGLAALFCHCSLSVLCICKFQDQEGKKKKPN